MTSYFVLTARVSAAVRPERKRLVGEHGAAVYLQRRQLRMAAAPGAFDSIMELSVAP